jgi:hypothetical protein
VVSNPVNPVNPVNPLSASWRNPAPAVPSLIDWVQIEIHSNIHRRLHGQFSLIIPFSGLKKVRI